MMCAKLWRIACCSLFIALFAHQLLRCTLASQKPTRSSLYINYFDKNKNMHPGTDILHPTNLACLGPLARKRRFHRTSWRLPPSTHDATFSHITTAHEAREAGEAPSALTIYCITRVGVGANTPIILDVSPSPYYFIRWSVATQEVNVWEISTLIAFYRREW